MIKKVSLILPIICFIQITYGQTPRQDLIKKVCDCFENEPSQINFDIDPFEECFDFSKEKYKGLIQKIVLQEIDTSQIGNKTSYEIGYKYGQNLFNDIQKPLVEECSAYFLFVKEMKKFLVSNTTKGVNNAKIDSLKTEYSKENWSPDEIFLIGGYELNQGNYSNAIKVFKDCLKKNSTHLASNFYLAITYDLSGYYDLAIEAYQNMIDLGENPITSIARIFLETAIMENKLKN